MPEDARMSLKIGDAFAPATVEPPTVGRTTTQGEFIRTASFVAKRAASWAGKTACFVNWSSSQPMHPDALQRFRAEIIELLDLISSPSTDARAAIAPQKQGEANGTQG